MWVRTIALVALHGIAHAGRKKSQFSLNLGYASSVQEAWDNHFGAFGGSDLKKIMLDYDTNSIIRIHDVTNPTMPLAEFNTPYAICGMFEKLLLSTLADRSKLEAPVVLVEESERQVFLVWSSPTDGVLNATDTFAFDDNFKIKRQNIVLKSDPNVPDVPFTSTLCEDYSLESEPKPKCDKTCGIWKKHLKALRKMKVKKVMKRYGKDSVIRVYDNTKRKLTEHTGLKQIKKYFKKFFKGQKDKKNKKKSAVVEINSVADADQVFYNWQGKGIVDATDTMIFDDKGVIRSHNIVMTTE